MKRILLIFLVFLLAIVVGNATAGEITFGAKFGMTMYNLTGTPAEWEADQLYNAGLIGGIFLNYEIKENLSIQPEILYTQKGVKSTLYDGFVLVDLTADFDYFELPVLLKYTFSGKGKFRPWILAGPVIGYNFDSMLSVSALLFSVDVDFTDLTHVTDFGIIAGTGFEYSLGSRVFTFEARYQLGFTNVMLSGDFEINGSTQTISEDDFKNYGFVFMAGYVF